MAPSYASADAAYRQASDQLRATCTVLEFHLPPTNTTESGESVILIPSARPRPRPISSSWTNLKVIESMMMGL